ncbi:MAG: outer membrane beta-barrel protein [Bacteroidota bacterium]
MKKKDLNTYINDKLGEGSGIPYKEEYWGDMNTLLDTNMPTTNAAAQTGTAVAKGAATGLKLVSIASICATAFTVSVLYTNMFPPHTKLATTSVSSSQIETENTSPAQSPEKGITQQFPENNTISEPLNNKAGDQKDAPQTSVSSTEIAAETPPISSDFLAPVAASNPEMPITSTSAVIPDQPNLAGNNQPNESVAGSTQSESTDHNVKYRSIDFVLLAPASTTTPTEIKDVTTRQAALIAYPNRNRFIQHIAVSPYVAYIHESDKQTFRKQNAEYIHPVQSHVAFGLNVECGNRQFAVRTGIGFSQTRQQTTVETSTDVYKVDTNYVIVNPNYGTTLSGKPVALIQSQFDSSVVATQVSSYGEGTTYQYLTIPLTLQYRVAHKRFLVVLEGGALHHFLISQQTNTPIQQANSETRLPVNGYSLQLTAGSGLRYALSSKWALGIQYNYNLNPSSANLQFLNNAHVATLMVTHTIR